MYRHLQLLFLCHIIYEIALYMLNENDFIKKN